MAKIAANTLRVRFNSLTTKPVNHKGIKSAYESVFTSRKAKLLAWAIFMIFFIENGTLGLLPKQYYFVYRNVRISDLLIYAVIVYSLFCVREYQDLLRSRALIMVKLILLYLCMHFIASVIIYNVNFIEYFFRLKLLWASFMILPYMLLLKRNGLGYLIKLIFPVSIVSNVLYILTALTGIAFLPDISVHKTTFIGGIEVYRVFGGTFLGEIFFLGFIFYWVTNKFKLYQLPLVMLFALPHILALGRGAWTFFLTSIVFIFIFNMIKKKDFKTVLRQVIIITVLLISFIFVLTSVIPESETVTGALEERLLQAESDVKHSEGTYGSRLFYQQTLVKYWSNNNIFLGIGMHPFWVVTPETKDEFIYQIGYSDLGWAPFLVSYGLVGFALAVIFQISFFIICFKILKKEKDSNVLTFFVLAMFSSIFFNSVVGYQFNLLSVGVGGFTLARSFYIAAVVYKYELLSNTSTNIKFILPFQRAKIKSRIEQ